MKIADLQSFVESLGALFASRTGTPQKDMVELRAALDPFKDFDLQSFTEFLKQAKEYRETGILPVATSKRKSSGGGRATKTPLKTTVDVEAIQEAVRELRELYESAADADLEYTAIESTVAAIEKSFDAKAMKEIAKGFDLTSGLTSKKSCRQKIEKKIKERRARIERGEVISERGKMETPIEPVLEATIVGE